MVEAGPPWGFPVADSCRQRIAAPYSGGACAAPAPPGQPLGERLCGSGRYPPSANSRGGSTNAAILLNAVGAGGLARPGPPSRGFASSAGGLRCGGLPRSLIAAPRLAVADSLLGSLAPGRASSRPHRLQGAVHDMTVLQEYVRGTQRRSTQPAAMPRRLRAAAAATLLALAAAFIPAEAGEWITASAWWTTLLCDRSRPAAAVAEGPSPHAPLPAAVCGPQVGDRPCPLPQQCCSIHVRLHSYWPAPLGQPERACALLPPPAVDP